MLILALAPLAALAQDYYGAIAYSPRTGAHGWAYDHTTRAAAEKTALQNCRKNADDCRSLVWFKNACGSLARGPKGYGWGWAPQQHAADVESMKACMKHSSGCNVIRQVCTRR
jgi:serine/threonine-protein kinase